MLGTKCLSLFGKIANENTVGQLICVRSLSLSSSKLSKDNYKLLVVGGGSGGITIAAKFNKILGSNNVAIVEPNDWHCNNTVY
jgi:hypothetical protein